MTKTTAVVELTERDPKKNSVRFRGGDRKADVVSDVYVNNAHPDIASAQAIRVTIEVIR